MGTTHVGGFSPAASRDDRSAVRRRRRCTGGIRDPHMVGDDVKGRWWRLCKSSVRPRGDRHPIPSVDGRLPAGADAQIMRGAPCASTSPGSLSRRPTHMHPVRPDLAVSVLPLSRFTELRSLSREVMDGLDRAPPGTCGRRAIPGPRRSTTTPSSSSDAACSHWAWRGRRARRASSGSSRVARSPWPWVTRRPLSRSRSGTPWCHPGARAGQAAGRSGGSSSSGGSDRWKNE